MSDDSKFWDEHRAGVADDGLDFSDVPKDIMDQLAAMEQTIAALQEKLRQAEAENERLLARCANISPTHTQVEINKRVQRITALEAECDELREQLAQEQDEHLSTARVLGETAGELDETKKQLAGVTAERDALLPTMASQYRECANRMSEQADTLAEALEGLLLDRNIKAYLPGPQVKKIQTALRAAGRGGDGEPK